MSNNNLQKMSSIVVYFMLQAQESKSAGKAMRSVICFLNFLSHAGLRQTTRTTKPGIFPAIL